MSPAQLEELKRTREIPETIRIVAPADGLVLARSISPGQRFERGAEWYRIADLRHAWILADVFQHEAPHLRPGTQATVSLPDQRAAIGARVSSVLPQFDGPTRTLKVRLEADNPHYVLRPDMFVDVDLKITLPPAITVPADAVLDSGVATTVFVERGNGTFEQRAVETGWRLGDRVEIVKGLEHGERIVTAGTFLLDSESRMRKGGASAHAGHDHGNHGAKGGDGHSGHGGQAVKGGHDSHAGHGGAAGDDSDHGSHSATGHKGAHDSHAGH
jgi:RND family efflux transporter MFP subunit